MNVNIKQPVIAIAITGASGSAYAMRLIETLIDQRCSLYIMISKAGHMVLKMEAGLTIPGSPKEAEKWLSSRFSARPGQIRVFGKQDWNAPIASGSNAPDALVVCPCTSGTLASIANGLSENLIGRAADVVIKEKKKLILVVRETPFSVIHLKNMLRLAETGVVIMPANPGFYHAPESIDDIVDFMVARILDQLGISHTLMRPWGENQET